MLPTIPESERIQPLKSAWVEWTRKALSLLNPDGGKWIIPIWGVLVTKHSLTTVSITVMEQPQAITTIRKSERELLIAYVEAAGYTIVPQPKVSPVSPLTPPGTRYYNSRAAARANCKPSKKVVRLGAFAPGSFGCWGRTTTSGQPVGGPNARIVIWATVPK